MPPFSSQPTIAVAACIVLVLASVVAVHTISRSKERQTKRDQLSGIVNQLSGTIRERIAASSADHPRVNKLDQALRLEAGHHPTMLGVNASSKAGVQRRSVIVFITRSHADLAATMVQVQFIRRVLRCAARIVVMVFDIDALPPHLREAFDPMPHVSLRKYHSDARVANMQLPPPIDMVMALCAAPLFAPLIILTPNTHIISMPDIAGLSPGAVREGSRTLGFAARHSTTLAALEWARDTLAGASTETTQAAAAAPRWLASAHSNTLLARAQADAQAWVQVSPEARKVTSGRRGWQLPPAWRTPQSPFPFPVRMRIINLESCTERWAAAQAQLAQIRWEADQTASRFNALRPPAGMPGHVGCSMSHLGAALEHAASADSHLPLVTMEDDFVWDFRTGMNPGIMRQALLPFRHKPFSVIFLSIANSRADKSLPGQVFTTGTQNITGTGYIVSPTYLPTFIVIFQAIVDRAQAAVQAGNTPLPLDFGWRHAIAADEWMLPCHSLLVQPSGFSMIESEMRTGVEEYFD